MAVETAYFVQFPHPGPEHNPPSGEMPWNTGKHRRKFLIAPGRYVGADDKIREAELVFWGEWEPPSRVTHPWPASGRLPHALHRPFWGEPKNQGVRQNTDPWVFGNRMIYSNCKQLGPRPWLNASSMQGLTRGSVICFGSTIDGEFCLDTVFVVASAEPWTPSGVRALNEDDAFRICVADSLLTNGGNFELMLYRGATFDDPVDRMFSFVPARRADADDQRFPRPPLRIPGLVNPANQQAPWGAKRPLPIVKVREAWKEVCRQVLASDLVLATHLRTPDRVDGEVVVPQTGRKRC